MTTPNNWPNPERLGVPPNPERDGLYAMRIDEKFIVRYWSATQRHYSLVPGWKKGISPSDASVFTFCGEILSPARIAEMLDQAERRAEQRVQAKIGRPVYQFKSGVSYWTDTTEIFYKARVLQGQEVRKLYRAEAIDAAREVGRCRNLILTAQTTSSAHTADMRTMTRGNQVTERRSLMRHVATAGKKCMSPAITPFPIHLKNWRLTMTFPRIEAAARAISEYVYERAGKPLKWEDMGDTRQDVARDYASVGLAAADAAAWRPIASAPEDTTILTYYRDGRVMADTFPYRGMLEWQEQLDAPPICWQPLPAPPANSAEMGGVDG